MSEERISPPTRLPVDSGVILTEACLGLALVAFTWAMLTMTGYVSTNHIRTLMAARHGAWTLGHGGSLNDSLKEQFFFEEDRPFVKVSAQGALLSIPGALTGAGSSASGTAPDGDDSWIVRVKFGMDESEMASTERFPFTLFKTKMPFMPETKLANWLMVESQAAWPAECNETWQSFWTALGKVFSMLMDQINGFISL